MSKKRKAPSKAARIKRVEAEAITRRKLRLAIVLTSAGAVLLIVGLLLRRGSVEGNGMYSARLFMVVVGVSLLLAGIVGLLAHVLVVGANKQVNKNRQG
jgi:predicted phage tail protein